MKLSDKAFNNCHFLGIMLTLIKIAAQPDAFYGCGRGLYTLLGENMINISCSAATSQTKNYYFSIITLNQPPMKKIPVLSEASMAIMILSLLYSCSENRETFSAMNLRCEYMVNPIGIDAENPRLTWQMNDKRQGAKQISYQIFIHTDSALAAKGTGNYWNSGKIRSALNRASYAGKKLLSALLSIPCLYR